MREKRGIPCPECPFEGGVLSIIYGQTASKSDAPCSASECNQRICSFTWSRSLPGPEMKLFRSGSIDLDHMLLLFDLRLCFLLRDGQGQDAILEGCTDVFLGHVLADIEASADIA